MGPKRMRKMCGKVSSGFKTPISDSWNCAIVTIRVALYRLAVSAISSALFFYLGTSSVGLGQTQLDRQKGGSNSSGSSESLVVVILDSSGSMDAPMNDPKSAKLVSRLDYAKLKVVDLIGQLAEQRRHHLRVISFVNGSPSLSYSSSEVLSPSSTQVAIESINRLKPEGGTPLAKSIDLAKDIFASHTSQQNSLVIFSDGQDDHGMIPVVEAVKNLVAMTGAKLRINMFAFSEAALFAEMQELTRVIVLGTLFLVKGIDGSSEAGFSLSWDSITGDLSQDSVQKRIQKQRTLGHIHAEHVHVFSAFERSVKRDEKRRLTKIDWEKLKQTDPDQYAHLKAWLEALEQKYMAIRGRMNASYLLSGTIRKTYTEPEISNLEIFRRVWAEEWGSTGYQGTPNRDYLKLSSLPLGYIAMEIIALSSLEPGRFGSNRIIGAGGFADALGSTVLSLAFGMPVSLGLALEAPRVASVLAPIFSSGVSANSASVGLKREGEKMERAVREQQEVEIERFRRYVGSLEQRKGLQQLFPNLSQAEIETRILKASQISDCPKCRVQVLFEGQPKLIEETQKAINLSEFVAQIVASQPDRPRQYMRDEDTLPVEIQAYLNSLRRELGELFYWGMGAQGDRSEFKKLAKDFEEEVQAFLKVI